MTLPPSPCDSTNYVNTANTPNNAFEARKFLRLDPDIQVLRTYISDHLNIEDIRSHETVKLETTDGHVQHDLINCTRHDVQLARGIDQGFLDTALDLFRRVQEGLNQTVDWITTVGSPDDYTEEDIEDLRLEIRLLGEVNEAILLRDFTHFQCHLSIAGQLVNQYGSHSTQIIVMEDGTDNPNSLILVSRDLASDSIEAYQVTLGAETKNLTPCMITELFKEGLINSLLEVAPPEILEEEIWQEIAWLMSDFLLPGTSCLNTNPGVTLASALLEIN